MIRRSRLILKPFTMTARQFDDLIYFFTPQSWVLRSLHTIDAPQPLQDVFQPPANQFPTVAKILWSTPESFQHLRRWAGAAEQYQTSPNASQPQPNLLPT
ncbi:hypothetical protein Bbelb_073940 [Branchiostoma belcheri]|nr:hypothetical protein Bbelb_073940 [Branchiostoma belcheri]